MSTLDASLPAFEPTTSRGRKPHVVTTAPPTDPTLKELTQSINETGDSQTRAASVSAGIYGGATAPSARHGNLPNGNTSSGHGRSQSVPNGGHTQRGGHAARGGALGRGRGTHKGRGRGGNTINGHHNAPHPGRRPNQSTPAAAPVKLDSVEDFPALGGPASSSTTSATSSAAASAAPSSTPPRSEPDYPSPAPTSPDAEEDKNASSAQKKASGSSERKPALSFARVVAPTPPPEAAPSTARAPVPPSSSTPEATSNTDQVATREGTAAGVSEIPRTNGSVAAGQPRKASYSELAQPTKGKRSKSPPTSRKESPRAHPSTTGDSHSSDEYHQAEATEATSEEAALSQSRGPGLTPLQQAFLSANNLSVEGLPNVGQYVSVEQLPNYYQPHATAATTPPTSTLSKSASAKSLSRPPKKSKKEKEKERELQYLQQQMLQDPHSYGYYPPSGGFPTQAQDDEFVDSQGQTSQGLSKSQSMSSFHFSVDAPSFTPHTFNVAAKEFSPSQSTRSTSPTTSTHANNFNIDAPSFSPRHDIAASTSLETKDSNAQHEDTAQSAVVLPEDVAHESVSTEEEAVSGSGPVADTSSAVVEERSSPSEINSAAEKAEDNEDGIKSPPHSTFSLLPPVTVEDVLDKASSLLGSGAAQEETPVAGLLDSKTTKEEGGPKPEQGEAEQSREGVMQDVPDAENEQEHPTAEVTENNLDELALPTMPEVEVQEADGAQAEEVKRSENSEQPEAEAEDAETVMNDTMLPQPSTSHSQESSSGSRLSDSTHPSEVSKHSLSPSEVEAGLFSANEQQDSASSALEAELQRATASAPAEKSSMIEQDKQQEEPALEDDASAVAPKKVNDDEADEPQQEQEEQVIEGQSEEASTEQQQVEHQQEQLDSATDQQSPKEAARDASRQDQQDLPPSTSNSPKPSDAPASPEKAIDRTKEDCDAVDEQASVPSDAMTKAATKDSKAVDEGGNAAESDVDRDMPSFQIISSSTEQCHGQQGGFENDIVGDGSHEAHSSAPSPPTAQTSSTAAHEERSNLQENGSQAPPPVVVSPTPLHEGLPSQNESTSSPSPANDIRTSLPPRLHRQPSQDEKEEAIRLVRELRSEPATPAIEEAESTVGYASSGARTPAMFSFEITEQMKDALSLGVDPTSTKRKREKDEESTMQAGKIARNDDDDDDDNDNNDNEKDKDAELSNGKKDEDKKKDGEAPSLTLSIFSGSILPRKQLVMSIFASLGINLLLPFVNGVMLGFGEIVARDYFAPWLQRIGLLRNRNTAATQPPRQSTLGTSGLGLRSAGARGGARDVPGHAAAKTAVEAVAENAVAGGSV